MTKSNSQQHRATYASDKRVGGYLVRVVGPYANRFVGREVPVTLKSGAVQPEMLVKLIWTGVDKDTQHPVALYKFRPRPAEEEEEIEF
jgi:hypothetical protein